MKFGRAVVTCNLKAVVHRDTGCARDARGAPGAKPDFDIPEIEIFKLAHIYSVYLRA